MAANQQHMTKTALWYVAFPLRQADTRLGTRVAEGGLRDLDTKNIH